MENVEGAPPPASLPQYAYDKETMLTILANNPAASARPTFLSTDFNNENELWSPELWIEHLWRRAGLTKDPEPQRPNKLGPASKTAKTLKKPATDLKDVVLSPQRRFPGGCHVDSRAAQSSSSKQDARSQPVVNSKGGRGESWRGGGSKQTFNPSWANGEGNNGNSRPGDGGYRDPKSGKAPWGHHRDQRGYQPREPEWFSGGPDDITDTIELKGFDDDMRQQMAALAAGKKQQVKEQQGTQQQQKPQEQDVQAQPAAAGISGSRFSKFFSGAATAANQGEETHAKEPKSEPQPPARPKVVDVAELEARLLKSSMSAEQSGKQQQASVNLENLFARASESNPAPATPQNAITEADLLKRTNPAAHAQQLPQLKPAPQTAQPGTQQAVGPQQQPITTQQQQMLQQQHIQSLLVQQQALSAARQAPQGQTAQQRQQVAELVAMQQLLMQSAAKAGLPPAGAPLMPPPGAPQSAQPQSNSVASNADLVKRMQDYARYTMEQNQEMQRRLLASGNQMLPNQQPQAAAPPPNTTSASPSPAVLPNTNMQRNFMPTQVLKQLHQQRQPTTAGGAAPVASQGGSTADVIPSTQERQRIYQQQQYQLMMRAQQQQQQHQHPQQAMTNHQKRSPSPLASQVPAGFAVPGGMQNQQSNQAALGHLPAGQRAELDRLFPQGIPPGVASNPTLIHILVKGQSSQLPHSQMAQMAAAAAVPGSVGGPPMHGGGLSVEELEARMRAVPRVRP